MDKDNTKENSVSKNEASPQIENGHLDIANELVEVLAKTQLSGYESRILWALWRKTWGWVAKDKKGKKIYVTTKNGKKQPQKLKKALISSKEWVNRTGLNKYNVSRTLKQLCLRQIVIKFDNKSIWGFQKDYSKWLAPIKRTLLSKRITTVIQNDNEIIQMDNKISGKPKGDKPLLIPKETLKETYVKKGEKDHTNKDNHLREKEEIISYWNTYKINPCKGIKPYIQDIEEALKDYSVEEIELAIRNYVYILTSEYYKFDYQYYLDSFLKPKTLVKFLDLEKAKNNYKDYAFRQEDEGDFVPEYYHSDKEQDQRTPEETRADREKISKLAGIELRKMKGK